MLNLPSFDKYEPLIKPGGVLIVNASMVDRDAKRDDITTIFIPCNEMAEEIGDRRLLNMVAVGANSPRKTSRLPSRPICRNATRTCCPRTTRPCARATSSRKNK